MSKLQHSQMLLPPAPSHTDSVTNDNDVTHWFVVSKPWVWHCSRCYLGLKEPEVTIFGQEGGAVNHKVAISYQSKCFLLFFNFFTLNGNIIYQIDIKLWWWRLETSDWDHELITKLFMFGGCLGAEEAELGATPRALLLFYFRTNSYFCDIGEKVLDLNPLTGKMDEWK